MQHYFGSSSPMSYYTLGRVYPRHKLRLPWRDTNKEKYIIALLFITSSPISNPGMPPCPYRPGMQTGSTELRDRPIDEQGAAGERALGQEDDTRRLRVDECR